MPRSKSVIRIRRSRCNERQDERQKDWMERVRGVRLHSVSHPDQRRAKMTTPSTSTPSNGLRVPGPKSLAVAIGVTALTATGAWAAQHAAQTGQGQAQQMQQQMQAGPTFEHMQEMMQQAREATDPA